MIDPTHKLPISRQTKLLGLARSTAYYQPKPVADSDLALMAAMDRLHLAYPFMGSRALRDNVLIERFWKTIKYQEVYLKAYESTSDARANIRRFIDFYNAVRGHSSLQGQPPDSVCFNNTGAAIAA